MRSLVVVGLLCLAVLCAPAMASVSLKLDVVGSAKIVQNVFINHGNYRNRVVDIVNGRYISTDSIVGTTVKEELNVVAKELSFDHEEVHPNFQSLLKFQADDVSLNLSELANHTSKEFSINYSLLANISQFENVISFNGYGHKVDIVNATNLNITDSTILGKLDSVNITIPLLNGSLTAISIVPEQATVVQSLNATSLSVNNTVTQNTYDIGIGAEYYDSLVGTFTNVTYESLLNFSL